MKPVSRPAVSIDLARVRANAETIRTHTGVELIAVVKANAYGLGARKVVEAIADVADAFYVFDASEALLYEGAGAGKPTISMLNSSDDPNDYVSRNIRPAVWSVERANLLRKAKPVLSVDTGQNRFGCLVDQVDAILKTGACDEAMSHATALSQAKELRAVTGGRVKKLHAAGTALLNEREAWLDAVRPGISLYADAVRVTARLVEARDVSGPAGYGGFSSSTGRLGVVVGGYSDGMRPGGVCLVNGVRRRIPEVGMQSAFVELGPDDKLGDEVVLLGDGLLPQEIASHWKSTPHEVLHRMANLGERSYQS